MVEHTLKFALQNFHNKNILLSTDSSLIRRIGTKYKVLCPWLRPKKYSTDLSSSLDAILHSVKWYEKNNDKLDYVILLQPTTPYRSKYTLTRCINLFLKEKNCTIKTIKLDKNLNKKKKILYSSNICSPNGSFYLIPRAHLFSNYPNQNKEKYILVLNKKENIDIDNYQDFLNAKKLLN